MDTDSKYTHQYLKSMNNIDLVLGIKNIFGLEGVINSWDCCFNFKQILILFFQKEHVIQKPKEQKLIKVEAPFIDEIWGLAIFKTLDKTTHNTMMLILKFMWNSAMLNVN